MAERGDLSIINEIDALASREPFVPFVIGTAGGGSYKISEGDTVSVGRGVVMIFRSKAGHHILRQGFITELSVSGELM